MVSLMNPRLFIILYLIIINIIGIVTMFVDKQKAKNNSNYRIPEKTLFSIALFLGAFGILIGMYKFRHKTMHTKFKIGIPILLFLNLICIYFVFKII